MATNYEVGVRLVAQDETAAGTQSAQKRVAEVAKKGDIHLKAHDHTEGPLNKLKERLGEITKMASGFALGSALANVGQGLVENLKGAVESMQTLGEATEKLSIRTGMSAEESSLLIGAMGQYGVSADQASGAFMRFSRAIDQVYNASGKQLESTSGAIGAMRELGLNVEEIKAKHEDLQTVLMQVADRFAAMPDGIEKSNAMLKLFGRAAGPDLEKFLNLGSDGIKEAMATAQKYGLQLSQENVEQIHAFGLAHRQLDAALQGVWVQAGLMLMPILASLANTALALAEKFNAYVMPAIKAFGGFVADTLMPALGDLASLIGETLGPVLAQLGDWWQSLSDAVSAVFTAFTSDAGAIGIVYDVIRHVFGDTIADYVQPFLQAFMEAIPAIQGFVGGVVTALGGFGAALMHALGGANLGQLLQGLLSGGAGALGNLLNAIGPTLKNIGPLLQSLGSTISSALSDPLGTITRLWQQLQATMEPFAPTADRLGQAFGAIGNAIKAMVPSPLVDFVTNLLGAAGNMTDAASSGDTLSTVANVLHGALDAIATVVNLVSAGVEALVTGIRNATSWLNEHREAQAVLVGVLGAVAAALTLIGVQMAITAAISGALAIAAGAQAFAQGVVTTATGAWTAAQALLNAVMDANPIGIVIVALAGLAAGLVWAYNNIQPFHDAVNQAWTTLQELGQIIAIVVGPAIATLGELFGKAAAFIQEHGDMIKDVLLVTLLPGVGLVAVAWEHDWGGIQEKVASFVDFIKGIPGQVEQALDQVGQAFSNLGTGVKGVMDQIQAAIQPIVGTLGNLGGAIANVVSKLPSLQMPSLQMPFASSSDQGVDTSAPSASTGVITHQTGGYLREPIFGVGMSTGRMHQLEAGEYVVPRGGMASPSGPGGARGGSGHTFNLNVNGTQISVSGGSEGTDWAGAADEMWQDLYSRLVHSLGNMGDFSPGY